MITKFYFLGFGILSFLTISCENELNINSDPNNSTKVPISTLLTASEVSIAYTLGGDATRIPASIVQHYAGHRGQPLEYAQYDITPSSTDGLWKSSYDALYDLKSIEKEGTKSNDMVYVGISQLLQAYTFSVLTDVFGDIPFTQSLLGSSNITPAYDTQESIYTALLALIDKGINNVKLNAGKKPTNDDVIYGGNIIKWEKFGNSLKLRLYNHLSKKNPTQALAFLNTNPSLILSNTDNAKVNFVDNAANANPIYQFDVLSGRKDNAVCSTIVNKMKSLNDPRVPVYFNPVANNSAGQAGKYLGNIPGGDTDDSGENLFSRVGSAYASVDSPVMFISAAEVNFIKSEIYFRANDLINSKASYENAITLDFSSIGVIGINTYLLDSQVAFDNTLSRIMEQKWITMFQSSYESFVDWRRTGFPVLTPPITNRTNSVIPRRLSYPQIEINVNNKSLSDGPGIPIPYQTLKTRVWWDVQ
ncbi:MAG: SusD/RagB family nutrient-binding outer membrane lipoprotein [Flavobacterium sp.]|uniref:SusD/RagB family nutrient-binding outer membrane lipoprotein n=1 Tax=Flavobacterium sp. TaxID=239 RepID=UPI00261253A6|nr:SusD/RagB family nutrient-binding outer membrane lipoprotein [Flavobacterium sp.]MDD5150488.1 SusD/RagB family nutrient-binding outer membrane lipoprotein [Flavobacterium sp.]